MPSSQQKWYHGVTRYQWLVLAIAASGWAFDAFEGQIFNISRDSMLSDLLRSGADNEAVKAWGEKFLGIFLVGGTLGGWVFSSMADKFGRKPVMALTILFYSVFSGLTAMATALWHVGVLRFLVAMGVGGEWAVGAALVAEVFPPQARARAGGIFHATSVVGLWLAAGAGIAVGTNWRMAYLIGIVPALLVLWVRVSVKEPETWEHAKMTKADELGSFRELLGNPRWRSHAVLGALLAMVGLATFWGVVIEGQKLSAYLLRHLPNPPADWEIDRKAKTAYGFVQNLGAGLGMLSFGPISVRLGRKKTFALMHVCALLITPAVCFLPAAMGSYTLLLVLLPFFGFFALAIHAGYAVYFPELFPTHLRATGAGFCFNTGRLLAAPVLFWISAWIKAKLPLPQAVTLMASLFLLGLVFLCFLPETRDQKLPE